MFWFSCGVAAVQKIIAIEIRLTHEISFKGLIFILSHDTMQNVIKTKYRIQRGGGIRAL